MMEGYCGAHLRRLAEDDPGFLDGEVADGVEDPVEGEAEFPVGALAGSFEACEDGFEAEWVVVAPHVDDADGDVDLGVDDALGGEAAPSCARRRARNPRGLTAAG